MIGIYIYILSLFLHLHTTFLPFSPSRISLMVSVDVKDHVYLLYCPSWSELKSCVKVEVFVNGSPSLIVLVGPELELNSVLEAKSGQSLFLLGLNVKRNLL